MANPRKTTDEEPRIPELRKVVLLRVNASHNPAESDAKTGQIKSKITREMSFDLLEPLTKSGGCRLRINVSVDATWKLETEEEPLITFQGEYEARFMFPSVVSMGQASAWLDSEFFCNAAIAQAIPIINAHMFEQLEMMGLRTSGRPIGFQPSSTDKEDAKVKPSVKAKSKLKPKSTAK